MAGQQAKPEAKKPDAVPAEVSSPATTPATPTSPEGSKVKRESVFEDYYALTKGKAVQCAAGVLRDEAEVTEAMLGKARLERLLEAKTVVVKKRRVK